MPSNVCKHTHTHTHTHTALMHKPHPFQSTTLDSFLLEISIDFQTSFPLLFRASLVAQMVKHLPAIQETQVWFLGCEDPLEKEMQSTPVLFSGKFRGRRSLVGYSAWDRKESATAERDFTSLTLNFIVPGIIFHFFFTWSFQSMLVAQQCLTLWDPMACRLLCP